MGFITGSGSGIRAILLAKYAINRGQPKGGRGLIGARRAPGVHTLEACASASTQFAPARTASCAARLPIGGVRTAVNIDDIKVTFSVSDLFFLICGISVPLYLNLRDGVIKVAPFFRSEFQVYRSQILF